MSPVTHLLTGWVVANCTPSLKSKERALVTLAGVVPDIDGLGAIPDLLTRNSTQALSWFSLYHHQLHNLAFGLIGAGVCLAFAKHRLTTGLLALLSFHLHLANDLLGARGPDGYQLPIPNLLPFSHTVQLSWKGQRELNVWPNFVITIFFWSASI
jgi:inner membrane protein